MAIQKPDSLPKESYARKIVRLKGYSRDEAIITIASRVSGFSCVCPQRNQALPSGDGVDGYSQLSEVARVRAGWRQKLKPALVSTTRRQNSEAKLRPSESRKSHVDQREIWAEKQAIEAGGGLVIAVGRAP